MILGCGRVGALVASELSPQHSVTVVDWSDGAFQRLAPEFAGRTVTGNGIDVDVLKAAGAAEADMFFALMDADNQNLMASQVALQLGARQAVARVYDPVRAEAFRKLGLRTISPTVTGARRLFDMIVGPGEVE